jgi:C1A family cysteine protease
MNAYGGYGWKRDLPGKLKRRFTAPRDIVLPESVDLRPGFPEPPYDQGQLGSCTANGVVGAVEYAQKAEGKWFFTGSRLFEYYNTRVIGGTPDSDAGGTISDAVAAANQYGIPQETDWPYDITQFTVKPPDRVYAAGKTNLVIVSAAVSQTFPEMGGCLAAKWPIIIGFTVYDSFESAAVAATGTVPMPNTASESVLGGHCVVIVGYDNSKKMFIVRNSWGTGWGDKGYCYFPEDYLLNPDMASDFQTIRKVAW